MEGKGYTHEHTCGRYSASNSLSPPGAPLTLHYAQALLSPESPRGKRTRTFINAMCTHTGPREQHRLRQNTPACRSDPTTRWSAHTRQHGRPKHTPACRSDPNTRWSALVRAHLQLIDLLLGVGLDGLHLPHHAVVVLQLACQGPHVPHAGSQVQLGLHAQQCLGQQPSASRERQRHEAFCKWAVVVVWSLNVWTLVQSPPTSTPTPTPNSTLFPHPHHKPPLTQATMT